MIIDKQNVRILVVDDDKESADGVVESLSDMGYLAEAAYGGREGINKFESGAFHLVITDLMMPDMDGMELLNAVKDRDSQAVVVVISGYGTIELAVKAIKNGAYDFISKPIKVAEMEVIVDRALERSNLFKQLGFFRSLTLALIISVPVWLILGIVLALLWKR